MQVEAPPASPFPMLPDCLPSRTIQQTQLKPLPVLNLLDSPTVDIPDLPKNAYGLESFADYCSAVQRVKSGLPAIEPVTPPDRNEPVIIHGAKFTYWNPDVPESDTESETTALQPASQNDAAKSTWSAASPRKSILRQSTSSPLVRTSVLPIPDEGQSRLVFDYASSASPSSRRTSYHSTRRFSIDVGVQSEPVEMPDSQEEVVRIAAEKRASGRRSSVMPVRSSFVQALAGFTGVARADSGAVICVANGRRFELVVEEDDGESGNEAAVQCSGIEIDSEMDALFGEHCTEEVIDVDAEDEATETGDKTGDKTAEEDVAAACSQDGDITTNTEENTGEVSKEVPSPEQLRSHSVVFTTPQISAVPNLEGLPGTTPQVSQKMTPAMITPTHLSLRSDAQETTRDAAFHDEIVATSLQAAHRSHFPQPRTPPKTRLSAPPRIAIPQRSVPDSDLQPQLDSPQTAPPAVTFVEQPHSTPVHAIANPTKTPPHPVTLGIVRQRSLSFKPAQSAPCSEPTPEQPVQLPQGPALYLAAVAGIDIRPTASAYQLAAMATLSPNSYLRAVQPPQSRIMFAFASPGGTAPIRGVNVSPPHLVSTPTIATLAVAPNSVARASLAAAPRRSILTIARTVPGTPGDQLRPVAGVQKTPGSYATEAQIGPQTEVLVTPAPLEKMAENLPEVAGSTIIANEKSTVPSRAASKRNRKSGSAARPQEIEVRQVDFGDEVDDDFDAMPDMDDDFDAAPEMGDDPVEIEAEIQPEIEIQLEPEFQSEPTKARSRKASAASSRSRASRKTEDSSGTERRRSSSVTQILEGTPEGSSDADFHVEEVEEEPEMLDIEPNVKEALPEPEEEEDEEGEEEEEVVPKKASKKASQKAKSTKQKKTGRQNSTKHRGEKRCRELQELQSLSTQDVNLNENNEEGGLRRSKRQRFPRLKFWRNETVSYERRHSQAIPTIAEVIVDIGGEDSSDDDTWFGRR